MIRLLFAKLIPLGLTGAFLSSSVSPIRPAIAAFGAATDALAGKSTSNSGADFEGMLAEQLKGSGIPGAEGAAKPAPPPNAKDELNDIIAQVKGQNAGEVGPAVAKAAKTTHTGSGHSAPKSTEAKAPEAPKGPETKLTSIGK